MGMPRLRARRPHEAAAPDIQHDPDLVRPFLEDAAHVPGGHAAGVAFPRDEAEVAALVRSADRVLAVGAQSSLTGGATPRGDVVLSTRRLLGVEFAGDTHVRAGAGVPLVDLQRTLAARRRYYPPVPTFDGAFVGGTIATNAAGAATFKYGSTRPWVQALTVVLADGSVLDLRRGETRAAGGLFEVEHADGRVTCVQVPTYRMPAVTKHSGGYFAATAADFDPIDLFIGSEGTLGVVVSATLRVIARPHTAIALITCRCDAHAIDVTAALRSDRDVDVAGIEYVGADALAVLDDEAFRRAGVPRPDERLVLLFVQFEGSVVRLAEVLREFHADGTVSVVMPGDDRGAERLFELREAVPTAVNRRVAEAKTRVHPDIEKTAADMIVPFDRLADSLALYHHAFNRRGLPQAIWGHFSDGNLHPNVLPRSLDDVVAGREAILEIGREVAAMGGSPLAEHGVGRNAVKQALLHQMYGDEGIEQMRRVKRALDPQGKLAPGVLFPSP